MSEYIQGIRIIQIFQRKNEVLELLKKRREKRYQSEIKAARIQYGVWALIGFATETVFLSIVLFIGIAEVSKSALSIGELVMLVEFVRQLTHPINSFGENFNSIQRSIVVLRKNTEHLISEATGHRLLWIRVQRFR